MTPETATPPPDDDPFLLQSTDDVLARCLRAPLDQQAARLDEACRAHPERETELREQFAILRGLGLADLAAEEGPSSASRRGSNPWPDGRKRFGDFELGEVIAEGGMGIVYRARQVSLDRDVALKLIRPELMHFPSTRKRFAREAEAVARLHHPGIVPIHAFGEEEGVPYIAMEFVEGLTLDELIRRSDGKPPARQQALDLGIQVASALHHAHARGIIHRDVKPSNILVDGHGRACLIDFGLHGLDVDLDESEASATERLTHEGSAPGTLLYMAPEQLETGAHDARSEVYSLGATLFELMTLRPPFRGENRSATEQLIRRGQLASMRRLNPSVTRDLEAVISKAMATDPTRRYVDCAAFASDLRSAMERRPVAARPDGALYRLRCWARRQPALATVSAAAALLAVGAPATIILQQRQHTGDMTRALEEERAARLAAEDLSDFVIDILESADPNLAKPTPAVEQILARSVEGLNERLVAYPERRAEVQRVLGRIHGSLGLYERGVQMLSESVAALEDQLAAAENSAEPLKRRRAVLARLVESRSAYARILELKGDTIAAYGEREKLAAEMAAQWPADHWRTLHARANWLHLASGLPDSAFENAPRPTTQEVHDALRAAAHALDASDEARPDLVAATQGWLGTLLIQEFQPLPASERGPLLAEARTAMEKSLAAFEASGSAGSLDEATGRNAYGLILKYQGDLEGCEEQYRRAYAIFEERLGPKNPSLGAASLNMAGLLEARGKADEAITMLKQANEIFRAVYEPDHPYCVHAIGNLAGTRYRAGDHEGLIELYDEVIARQIALFPESHPFPPASFEHRGMLKLAKGDRDGAKTDLQEALRRFRLQPGVTEEFGPIVRLRAAIESL
ncbi:Serine/threonine-protein kinase PrkC [Planctomycetes bacterium Poly30]|uniref:Serine/threonine-protein kinase PrkC n=1 Tax=Saltatorellus ferox TaxID=2528018 RepID=A0A518EM05_9BACT|nr:Serine/threonine-protein kinase PrkC [Planctomycetes bacterium Poly30]